MSDMMDKMSKQLAAKSSRGGFLATLGKVTLGLAAAVATGSGLADNAEAASIKCCSGTPCMYSHCPTAAPYNNYTWKCGQKFYCHDCYTSSTGGYRCTYVSTTA